MKIYRIKESLMDDLLEVLSDNRLNHIGLIIGDIQEMQEKLEKLVEVQDKACEYKTWATCK